MQIILNKDYYATAYNTILGFVGEEHARYIEVVNHSIESANVYEIHMLFEDNTYKTLDIINGKALITEDLVQTPGLVKLQIVAENVTDKKRELVKKSNIFTAYVKKSL